MERFAFRICLIYDIAYTDYTKSEKVLTDAIDGGVDLIMYRDFLSSDAQKIDIATNIRNIVKDRKIGFIVNRWVDLAKKVDADGVHVGGNYKIIGDVKKQIGENKFVSASCHNKGEVQSASTCSADMLFLSPFFSPGCKVTNIAPLGPDRFLELSNLTDKPVFALGGITPENVHIPFRCGACGVASITGLLHSPNIYLAAKRMSSA